MFFFFFFFFFVFFCLTVMVTITTPLNVSQYLYENKVNASVLIGSMTYRFNKLEACCQMRPIDNKIFLSQYY